jgi:hypothetical protein
MKTLLLPIALLAALSLSGCASSPVSPVATASTAGQLAGTALGATVAGAAGYVAGGLIDNNNASKAIGAATAATIYVTATEIEKNKKNQGIAEAYEQGRRDGRTEAAKEYWDAVTDANGDLVRNAQKLKTSGVRQMQYDGRYTEGVNNGGAYVVDPNTGLSPVKGAEQPALQEPARGNPPPPPSN